MVLFLSAVIFVLNLRNSLCQLSVPPVQNGSAHIIFEPPEVMGSPEGSTHEVEWFTSLSGADHVSFGIYDPRVNSVINFTESIRDRTGESNVTGRGIFNISSDFVGYNVINLTVYDKNNQSLGVGYLRLSVALSYERLNKIFTYILTLIIVTLFILMGATIDLEVVKKIVKRPVGPVVGLICQYIFMPVIAFAIAKLVFYDNELMQLGMFLSGASPGGGNSNAYTLLLGGSLDLSIMMTFVSTCCAFGAVPLWVLSLGPKILGEDHQFVIPYANIGYIVLSLSIPCLIGLLIQRYAPRVSKFMEKRVLGPVSVFNIVFIFTVGVYSHRYIFYFFTPRILWAAFTLPALGYLSGIILSLLTRRNLRDMVAIAIETGVQNTNIGMIIIKFTLERPASDLAVVTSAYSVLMTPIIPLIALSVKAVYGRIRSLRQGDSTKTLEKGKTEDGTIGNTVQSEDEQKEQSKYTPNPQAGIRSRNDDRMFGVDNPGIILDEDYL